jgi:hypothetical protein
MRLSYTLRILCVSALLIRSPKCNEYDERQTRIVHAIARSPIGWLYRCLLCEQYLPDALYLDRAVSYRGSIAHGSATFTSGANNSHLASAYDFQYATLQVAVNLATEF